MNTKNKRFIYQWILILLSMGISYYLSFYLDNLYLALAAIIFLSVLLAFILYKNFNGKDIENIKEYIIKLKNRNFAALDEIAISEDIKGN